MTAYLKIENPGVAPEQAFTLLGASTKRGTESKFTVGRFGSGNKHAAAVLLRNALPPVIFPGKLKMEFGTRPESMNDHQFARVFVKYGGVDPITGKNRSNTEDLGFVLEYGATDWLTVDLALREFVSNALDQAGQEEDILFAHEYIQQHPDLPKNANEWTPTEKTTFKAAFNEFQSSVHYKPQDRVKIEVVDENQVRAKKGVTRVFVPMNAEVLAFYNNIGKWFLHFSEPESLGKTILPKRDRNLSGKHTAVIYRRGVRVREVEASNTVALFDYNLENLDLDESRRVDDYKVATEAARALSNADEGILQRLVQSFIDGHEFWEHSFSRWYLKPYTEDARQRWQSAFIKVAGENAVAASKDGGEMAARKGYKVVHLPEEYVHAAEGAGIRTPASVLSADDKEGRLVMDSVPDAEAAVDFAWDLITRYKLTNGKTRPVVKTFRKIMDGGAQTLGYYRDGVVYINQDIAGNISLSAGWHGLTQQLMVTALEECGHHASGGIDFSRDMQDFVLNLVVYLAKDRAGIS